MELRFERHGAARHDDAARPVLGRLETLLACCSKDRAGVRLNGTDGLAASLAITSPIGRIAGARLGTGAFPVRAILFDKTPGANWALGWHQDRTVAVRKRADVPGYGPWSVKAGVAHVEPPFSVIEAMVTLRIHLDPVPADNAPLLIAPGSHRLGRVAESDVDAAVKQCGAVACLAERGDIWCYATPVLHASAASSGHMHRRVLQVDYAAVPLAPPLEWFGV